MTSYPEGHGFAAIFYPAGRDFALSTSSLGVDPWEF